MSKEKVSRTLSGTTRNPDIGYKAKDIITGRKGTITGFIQYITGCDQYLITPKGDEKGFWVDVNRVVITSDEKLELETDKDSGPMDEGPIK